MNIKTIHKICSEIKSKYREKSKRNKEFKKLFNYIKNSNVFHGNKKTSYKIIVQYKTKV